LRRNQAVATRRRIVHAYHDMDPDIVWHIATEDIEAVIASLERVLSA
jgi:uncharacterized protein with HEPN domain